MATADIICLQYELQKNLQFDEYQKSDDYSIDLTLTAAKVLEERKNDFALFFV